MRIAVQHFMWSNPMQLLRGLALLCASGLLVSMLVAQPNSYQSSEYDQVRTRGIENRERISSIEARVHSLESLRIEARLSRIESSIESMEYWTRGLMIGIALLLIEAFGRFILTRRKE